MLPRCRTIGEPFVMPIFDVQGSDVEGFMEELPLQRHLIALLKFAPVESRFCSCKQRGKATFDTPINPCARSACSRSVAVGLSSISVSFFANY